MADPIRQAVRRKQHRTAALLRDWYVRFGVAIPDPKGTPADDPAPDDIGDAIPSAATIKAAAETARANR